MVGLSSDSIIASSGSLFPFSRCQNKGIDVLQTTMIVMLFFLSGCRGVMSTGIQTIIRLLIARTDVLQRTNVS